jgi:hypothetical protein
MYVSKNIIYVILDIFKFKKIINIIHNSIIKNYDFMSSFKHWVQVLLNFSLFYFNQYI